MHGSLVEKVLRVSLAFSFIYPAVSAWFNPFAWVGYFPPFVLDLASSLPALHAQAGNDLLVLHVFGVTEIIIGLWLVFGKRIFWPGILAAFYLAGIVVFNLNQMDVIFRDISIFGIAVALVLMDRNKPHISTAVEE